MALPTKVPRQVRAIKCTQCGGPLTIRDPIHCQSVACGSCGSVLDARHPDLAVLGQIGKRVNFTPEIPLGQRGTLEGAPWECLGVMVRRTTVEGIVYSWREYLLANPFRGYRWLVESQGHWVFVKPVLSNPEPVAEVKRTNAQYDGVLFKCFQTCTATVALVLGEFYWQVEVGESTAVTDYVAPPRQLSLEKSAREWNWSEGTYISADEVKAAFKLKQSLREPIDIGPSQPNPFVAESGDMMTLCMQFLLAALLLQAYFTMTASGKTVLTYDGKYDAAQAEKSVVTPTFQLEGRTSGVEVATRAGVDNHWVYLSMALINEETDVAYDFGREISFYHGYDDGVWTEGSSTDEVLLPAIPAGRYYLRIEPQSDMPAATYAVKLIRDPRRVWPFFVAAFLLLMPPVLSWFRKHGFEVKRWSNSDFPLVDTTSSSDDD